MSGVFLLALSMDKVMAPWHCSPIISKVRPLDEVGWGISLLFEVFAKKLSGRAGHPITNNQVMTYQ
ncbi:hypothetical protein [Agrobacterium vitis]|uniref:hypothetical protein n=1 Tax=Agrobacterium vitis TaxID=373 RepID=UPI00157300B9|nr:hypothetical protein [Agrobacterium vitis]NSZ19888.1 hypothetical protein [Agrobacterium vitis]QZO07583.1 hypothetical protein K4831_25385 [Agrobacterium vitis]UJL90777.1 hypothetical protein AVF2S5_22400 [Agrobacterium vitis]